MTTIFHDMMNQNIEDYDDDILVKSQIREDHFGTLREVFQRYHLNKLRMNPLESPQENYWAFLFTNVVLMWIVPRHKPLQP